MRYAIVFLVLSVALCSCVSQDKSYTISYEKLNGEFLSFLLALDKYDELQMDFREKKFIGTMLVYSGDKFDSLSDKLKNKFGRPTLGSGDSHKMDVWRLEDRKVGLMISYDAEKDETHIIAIPFLPARQ